MLLWSKLRNSGQPMSNLVSNKLRNPKLSRSRPTCGRSRPRRPINSVVGASLANLGPNLLDSVLTGVGIIDASARPISTDVRRSGAGSENSRPASTCWAGCVLEYG